ncbi:MAG TPA: DUF6542 domain-containing protein [Streptosporangiaceae bacterium]|nr:DUF6542 domain-containing protein [Streptosporangiaceae bacterium]
MPGQTQPHATQAQLTGRGAVVGMLAVFALGLLAASWLGWAVLAGASFAAGTAAAAFYVRRDDLLPVMIAPPLLFGIALVVVKAGTATGNVALSTAEGVAVTLAGAAPWLLAGTALNLVIAWARGARECVRELRADLRSAARWPAPAAGPRAGPAAPGAPRAQDAPRAQVAPPRDQDTLPPDLDAAVRSPDAPPSATSPDPGLAAQDAPPSAS